jgi:hypothetical protein
MTAEVRQGDWRDVLPGTYDPARAVVITDPPYGLEAPGFAAWGGSRTGAARASAGKGYADVIPWADHVRDVLTLLPAKRHVIRGPATLIVRRDHPQPRRLCIEVAAYRARSSNHPGAVPYAWQGWCVYGRLRLDPGRPRAPAADWVKVNAYQDDGRRGTRRDHKGVTPVHAAAFVVDLWTDAGDLVLDPFAGVGTIGSVAVSIGRDYLGAELDPRWAADAAAWVAIGRPTLAL